MLLQRLRLLSVLGRSSVSLKTNELNVNSGDCPDDRIDVKDVVLLIGGRL